MSMNFNCFNIESFALRCKKCGDRVCICHDDSNWKWAAHCMSCENNIGHIGFYDPCADNEFEACKRWNDLNRRHELLRVSRYLSLN